MKDMSRDDLMEEVKRAKTIACRYREEHQSLAFYVEVMAQKSAQEKAKYVDLDERFNSELIELEEKYEDDKAQTMVLFETMTAQLKAGLLASLGKNKVLAAENEALKEQLGMG